MGDLINLIICVDDTDDLTKSTSTGAVAERIADVVRKCGGLLDLDITRHQLLLDERVNYTSHNSSMAMSARIVEDSLDDVYRGAVAAIEEMKAATADPGLCFVVVPEDDWEAAEGIAALVDFGMRAKREYVTIDEAFRLANAIPWVALTEHGGTGEGVIGALAGAGLRLSGSDGRFRGKWDLVDLCFADGDGLVSNARKQRASGRGDEVLSRPLDQKESGSRSLSCPDGVPLERPYEEEPLLVPAGEVLDLLREEVHGPVRILTEEGEPLDTHVPLAILRDAKPVMHGNALTFVVKVRNGVAWPCSKTGLDELHSGFADMNRTCAQFEPDNDEEETAAVDEAAHTCPNCLYRRWVPQGFACMKMED